MNEKINIGDFIKYSVQRDDIANVFWIYAIIVSARGDIMVISDNDERAELRWPIGKVTQILLPEKTSATFKKVCKSDRRE